MSHNLIKFKSNIQLAIMLRHPVNTVTNGPKQIAIQEAVSLGEGQILFFITLQFAQENVKVKIYFPLTF